VIIFIIAFPLRPATWGPYFSKIAYPKRISESEFWDEFKTSARGKTEIPDQVRRFIKRELWLLNLTGGIIFVGEGSKHYFIQIQRTQSDATLIFIFDKSWGFIGCYSMGLA